MISFIPYEKKFNRKHDFLVKYEFIENQADYVTTLRQGMRSDFCYEEDSETGPNYMIWPEFEDSNGAIILDEEVSISDKGRARMWIMLEESRPLHKTRIKKGKKGFLVAGAHKIAKVEVIEIVNQGT